MHKIVIYCLLVRASSLSSSTHSFHIASLLKPNLYDERAQQNPEHRLWRWKDSLLGMAEDPGVVDARPRTIRALSSFCVINGADLGVEEVISLGGSKCPQLF